MMAKDKLYKSGDIVEAHNNLYTVHSHTDDLELLGRAHHNGELYMVKLRDITKSWNQIEE